MDFLLKSKANKFKFQVLGSWPLPFGPKEGPSSLQEKERKKRKEKERNKNQSLNTVPKMAGLFP